MPTRKLLWLLLALTLALTAVWAPGSAMAATNLCKEAMKSCEAGKKYPSGTEFKATSGAVTIKVGSLTVKCDGSTLNFKTTALEGAPLTGEVLEFTFNGCTGCTSVTAIHLNYKLEIERTIPDFAGLSISKAAAGNPAIKLGSCTGGVACTFQAESLSTSLVGGTPAGYAFNNAPMSKEGVGGCTGEAFLSVSYGITFVKEPGGNWTMNLGVWPEA